MTEGLRKWRFAGLVLLLFLALLLDLSAGSVRIPLREMVRIFFSSSGGNDTWRFIVEQIRLPKACAAVMAGCGLSVGGLQMQTLFRNPLADPGILGITAGASLGVAAVMLAGGSIATIYAIKELGVTGSWLITVAACTGAGLVMLLVLALSARLRDNVVMLIIGLMLGSVTLAITSIWQYFSNPQDVKEYLLWTFGSLGGVTGMQLFILAVMVLIGLAAAFLSSKMLDALLLGENYARSMGLTVRRARLVIICSTSLLAGSITAFCGPIGFIGLAVPHLARGFFNTASHRILMPACCLIGTILLLLCDSIAQWPGSQTVLPINIVTSLVGAPTVIFLLLRKKNINAYR
ncbi:iron ABC transporter permease [Puia dinghuensis]|uniref:Iron(III) ABC transporter permease n=1 Tax=Puia dinghuensis TaxID=1792502 RepID=A0A8J2XU01_9BACT|nr:iron ABC transporter permease [Puia dinghuensis]GGB07997.1 iron(III) ABC transporter permease [Puia dinghuensis]